MLSFKNGNRLYFTSDTHYWHNKPFILERRKFSNVQEMNESMVWKHNIRVGHKDIVFHLGDFILGGVPQKLDILERLNGRFYLCASEGTHDKELKRIKSHFVDIRESYLIKVGEAVIYLHHYFHKIWPRSHYGAWHLFGHSHGGMDNYAETEGKLLDVGVDSHDFLPWSFEEIEGVMATRPLNFNDLRRRENNE